MKRRQIPIEMRFIDLFMLLIGALVCILFISTDVKYKPPPPPVEGNQKFPIPKLEIVTRELPVALKGVPYALTLSAAGGCGNYSWRITDGVLSKGLQLDSKMGLISGNTQELGTKLFSVQLTDEMGVSVNRELVIHVRGKTTDTDFLCMKTETLELPEAVETEPYTFILNPAGGSPPFRLRILEGSLPPGLYLEPGGAINGKPRLYPPGSGSGSRGKVRVSVTDSRGAYLEQMLVIPIKPKPLVPEQSNKALSKITRLIFKILLFIALFNIAVLLLLFICGFRGGLVNRAYGLLKAKGDYEI